MAASAAAFHEKRPILELALIDQLRTASLLNPQVSDAMTRFGDELQAALDLGDPALVEADLEWVGFLLSKRDISNDHMTPFLLNYRQAVEVALGLHCQPITAWFDAYTARRKEPNDQPQTPQL